MEIPRRWVRNQIDYIIIQYRRAKFNKKCKNISYMLRFILKQLRLTKKRTRGKVVKRRNFKIISKEILLSSRSKTQMPRASKLDKYD